MIITFIYNMRQSLIFAHLAKIEIWQSLQDITTAIGGGFSSSIKILDSTAEGYIIQIESERAVLDTESRKTDDGVASMFLNMTQGHSN